RPSHIGGRGTGPRAPGPAAPPPVACGRRVSGEGALIVIWTGAWPPVRLIPSLVSSPATFVVGTTTRQRRTCNGDAAVRVSIRVSVDSPSVHRTSLTTPGSTSWPDLVPSCAHLRQTTLSSRPSLDG